MHPTHDQITTSPRRPRRRQRRLAAHIIDRALDAVRLSRERNWSAARLGRHWGRTRGYASIVLRLGKALAGAPSLELEVLRSPRITYKVAQRVIRQGMDAAAIKRALLKEISWPTQDGRRRRGKAVSTSAATVGLAGWTWDPKLAAEDPIGFLADYCTAVLEHHREVSAKMRAVLDKSPAPFIPLAGQSLASLTASLSRAGSTPAGASLSPSHRQALKRLSELDAYFAELRRGGLNY